MIWQFIMIFSPLRKQTVSSHYINKHNIILAENDALSQRGSEKYWLSICSQYCCNCCRSSSSQPLDVGRYLSPHTQHPYMALIKWHLTAAALSFSCMTLKIHEVGKFYDKIDKMWEERWISLREKIKSEVRLTVSHHSWRKNVVWDHRTWCP